MIYPGSLREQSWDANQNSLPFLIACSLIISEGLSLRRGTLKQTVWHSGKIVGFRGGTPGSNPNSATFYLCDLEEVT